MPSRKILVIEDNADVRELLCLALEDHDVRAVAEIGGENVPASFAPDLVFTDLSLGTAQDPDQVVSEVKARFPKARIFILSGNAEVAAIAKRHALEFLVKPVDLDVLTSLAAVTPALA